MEFCQVDCYLDFEPSPLGVFEDPLHWVFPIRGPAGVVETGLKQMVHVLHLMHPVQNVLRARPGEPEATRGRRWVLPDYVESSSRSEVLFESPKELRLEVRGTAIEGAEEVVRQDEVVLLA